MFAEAMMTTWPEAAAFGVLMAFFAWVAWLNLRVPPRDGGDE